MSFLQQQTAWVLRFFVFPGTKSGVEGWSSQQGRKKKERRRSKILIKSRQQQFLKNRNSRKSKWSFKFQSTHHKRQGPN
jgi:hypothetical protein